MAKKWAKFPHADKAYAYDAAGLKKAWARLHKGDGEPFPKDADVLEAWRHFHAGDFAARRSKRDRRRAAPGVNAAVKAQIGLRQLSREIGQGEDRPARGGRRAGGRAPARGAEGCQRALPLRVRARPLQPGHLGRQGAGARFRRQDQGGAADRAQARRQARRRAHRATAPTRPR